MPNSPSTPNAGTEKVSGFKIQTGNPIDPREWVADSTARLNLEFPYFGLKVRQGDNDQIYRYIGDRTTNISSDWELVHEIRVGNGVPSVALGNLGDYYIRIDTQQFYEKTAINVWTELFSLAGSKILYGSGVPSSGLGNISDSYVDIATGDLYEKTDGTTWALQFNIKGTNGLNGDRYATTSTTSINLTTLGSSGSIVVGTGLAYTAGQSIIVASRANPTTEFFTATVTLYNSGSGLMNYTDTSITGTATRTDWDVNLSGAEGRIGKAFIHTEKDINLTTSKVSSIQAGSWTPQNPWSASIINDTRSNKSVPAGIVGDKAGHSIAWDGSQWYDNGTWRGANGTIGAVGATGPQGPAGTNGTAIVRNYQISGSTTTFNIPKENVVGFYEIRIRIIVSHTGRVTINLPTRSAGDNIHYRIVIAREENTTQSQPNTLRVQGGATGNIFRYVSSSSIFTFGNADYYHNFESVLTFVSSDFIISGLLIWYPVSDYAPELLNQTISVPTTAKVGGFKSLVGRYGSSVLDANSTNHADYRTGDGNVSEGVTISGITYPTGSVGISSGEIRIRASTYVRPIISGTPASTVLMELWVRSSADGIAQRVRTKLITLSNQEGWNTNFIEIDYYRPDIPGGTTQFYLKVFGFRGGNVQNLLYSRSVSYNIDYNKVVPLS